MKLFDELLVLLVRRRLTRSAKQFSDALLQAIAAEMVRRPSVAGFDEKAFQASIAQIQARLEAGAQFESLDVQSVHVQ